MPGEQVCRAAIQRRDKKQRGHEKGIQSFFPNHLFFLLRWGSKGWGIWLEGFLVAPI
jgi:hypothetical protein